MGRVEVFHNVGVILWMVVILQPLVSLAGHHSGESLEDKSFAPTPMMPALYRYNRTNASFHRSDDIRATQALYSRKKTVLRKTKPKSQSRSGICSDMKLDAILGYDEGPDCMFSYYVFKGGNCWFVDKSGGQFKLRISSIWGDLPDNIDAAFTDFNKWYIFQGNNCWRFRRVGGFGYLKKDHGYPKKISEVFPGIPNNLDAAFIFTRNKRLYFIKDSQYWRMKKNMKDISSGYPQNLNKFFRGLPDKIDAASQFKDITYLFKGNTAYRVDRIKGSRCVEEDGAGPTIFGCHDSSEKN